MDKMGINLNLLITQIVHFILLLFLLRMLLYKPISNIFEQRREKIASSLAEADKVRAQAASERQQLEAQIAEERRSSQEKLRTAVAQSEEAAGRRLAEASAEAEAILAKARADAEETRQNALAGLQGQIADLALLAAGKVLGESVDDAKHRSLVDRVLKSELGDIA